MNTLQNGIKDEEDKQLHEISQFQDILSNLSNEMADAGRYHSKENLNNEMTNTENQLEEAGETSHRYSQQHADICAQIQNLQLEEGQVFIILCCINLFRLELQPLTGFFFNMCKT